MTRIRVSLLVLLLFAQGVLLSTAPLVGSATGATARRQDKPVRLKTDEVVVDAVVVDKKGRVVTDLTAADFEVFEDGAKQKINSFRFESSSIGSEAAGEKVPGVRPMSLQSANLVSLVFDAQTSRDGAQRARRAAMDFVESGMKPNDYVAVFGIDLGLVVLAPFTNDKAALRRAIDAFTSKESKKYLAVSGEVRSALESLVEPGSDAKRIAYSDQFADPDAAISAPGASRDTRGDPQEIDPAKLMIATIALTGLRVLRTFDRYEREFQGWRSVSALLAIINGQRHTEVARKTLMYFSEGFSVTPAVRQQYLSIISAANTAGVTIYALDVAGLRIVNPNEDAMRERDAAAYARMRNANPELVQGGVSALGRAEEVAGLNTVSTMDQLSEETGGYTIKNTNDLSEGLKRLLEQLGSHYSFSYQPTNENYRGEFRHIAVKLARPGDYRIRARRGYYALRSLDETPLLAYEVPLIERMNTAGPANDFPLYGQALTFRGTKDARQAAVYVEFPVSALKFDVDQKAKTFASRFAVLALVKNSNGEIVRKMGQEFALRGPLSQLEEVKARPQIYNRLLMLGPGKYTLEAVARDSGTGQSSLVRMPFEVAPANEDRVAVSSVVLSRGLSPLSEEQKKQHHPLYLEGQAYFLPNVGETFSIAKDKNLMVHFDVYAPKAVNGVSATLAFYQKGSVFTQAGGALPAPDATGTISYATAFGTENFPPGDYELRVTVTDGKTRDLSSAHFRIER